MLDKTGMVFLCFGGGVIKINRGIAVVAAAIILLVFLQSGVCAAGAATVYADKVNAEPGETVLISVKIKDNPGIMGFKVTVKYPEQIDLPKAMSGTVTAGGMLNDSIGVMSLIVLTAVAMIYIIKQNRNDEEEKVPQ